MVSVSVTASNKRMFMLNFEPRNAGVLLAMKIALKLFRPLVEQNSDEEYKTRNDDFGIPISIKIVCCGPQLWRAGGASHSQ